MNDPEFDDLLRASDKDVAVPASFRAEVWNRIERAEQRSLSGRWRLLVDALARPWPAATSVAAMVALGLWLGAASAPEARDAKVSYAESISPFLHPSSE